jgi:hypothetical protein
MKKTMKTLIDKGIFGRLSAKIPAMIFTMLLVMGFGANSVKAQYIVNFEGVGETKTAYASGNVTLSGLQWNLTEVLIGTEAADYKVGLRSARLRGYGTSAITMLANKAGVGSVSFSYSRYGTDAQTAWRVEYSTNDGVSWTQLGSDFTADATIQNFSADLNTPDNVRIRIRKVVQTGTTNLRMNIDDITLTDYVVQLDPNISLTPNTLNQFTYVEGNGPSSSQSVEVSGSNLLADISNLGVNYHEFSLDDIAFSPTLNDLVAISGTVAPTTIYIRLQAGLSVGTYYDLLAFISLDADTAFVTLNGEVTSSCLAADDAADFAALAGDEEVSLSWTNGNCFDEYMVVASQNGPISTIPSGDGTNYIANNLFSLGTDISEFFEEYAVYKGTGTSVDVVALTNGVEYYFTIFGRLGTNWSTGVSITATPQSPPPPPSCVELFFSEYIEGTSNNKYLEIYNPTNGTVDLSTYTVSLYTNGSPTVSASVNLTGSLAPYSTFVMAHSSATLYGGTPNYSVNGGVLNFNGDDAVALSNNNVIIDVIGQIGVDPGAAWVGSGCSTVDRTLVRKSTVGYGDADGSNPFDPSVEWDCNAVNEITFLGAHTSDCAAEAPSITVDPNLVNGLDYIEGSGPSASSTFEVSGENLTGLIFTLDTLTYFEFSFDDVTYGPSVSELSPTGGIVNPTTIYVRLIAGLTPGVYGESITFSSIGAANIAVALSGNVTPAPVIPCTELFISEYVEGTSNNKYLEIYNPNGTAVGLTDYSLAIYSNGSVTVSSSLNLVGSIPAYGTHVIAHTSAVIYGGTANQTVNGGVVGFNGDDAVALRKNGVNIDVIGQIGVDPGTEWAGNGCSTANRTIVRKANVTSGDDNGADVFDPSLEWDCYDVDDVTNLGQHASECAPDCAAPSVFIFVEDDCNASTFSVAIEIQNDGDAPDYGVSYAVNNGTPVFLDVYQTGPNATFVAIGSFNFGDEVDVFVAHNGESYCNQVLPGISSTGDSCTPINNDCDDAIALVPMVANVPYGLGLPAQTTAIGTLHGATASGSGSCGSTLDVFYSLNVPYENHYTITVNPFGGADVAFELLNACAGTSLACVNNGGASVVESSVTLNLAAGDYIIRVSGASLSAPEGQFLINVQAAPVTKVMDGTGCNATGLQLEDVIRCNLVTGALDYEWRFVEVGGGLDATYVRGSNNRNLRLSWIDGIDYNKLYNVYVRAQFNLPGAGVVWGAYRIYGDVTLLGSSDCTVETGVSVTPTQVQPAYSPNSPLTSAPYALCNNVRANYVAAAEQYEWEFTGPAPIGTYCDQAQGSAGFPSNPACQADVCGIDPFCCDTTWDGICADEASLFASCTSCLTPASTILVTSPSYFIPLSNVPGIQMNTVYQVRVRARVNGLWGTFGVSLPVALGLPANTSIWASHCNTVRPLSGAGSNVAAFNVCAAQSYTFRFQHVSEPERIVVRPTYVCPFNTVVPALTPGQTYTVSVKVTQGGVAGDYSTSCPITIAGPQAEGIANDVAVTKVLETGNLGIYPNPNAGTEVRVDLNGIADGYHDVAVTIYDIYGKLMTRDVFGHQGAELSRLVRFEQELATGMYLVHVTIDGETFATQKMIVR